MSAKDDVEKFLQESFIAEDEFDTFAEELYKQIENNVSTIASRNSSAQISQFLLKCLDGPISCSITSQRESIVNVVSSNEKVQFYWAMLSFGIEQTEAAK